MKEHATPSDELIQLIHDITIGDDTDGMEPKKLVKEIYKMTSKYLSRTDKRPWCPDCEEVMVKSRRSDIEDRGVVIVWLCGCEALQDVVNA